MSCSHEFGPGALYNTQHGMIDVQRCDGVVTFREVDAGDVREERRAYRLRRAAVAWLATYPSAVRPGDRFRLYLQGGREV
jgi:hypothetical protein